MDDAAEELDRLRREIDAIDDELIQLLDRRAGLSRAVARVKERTGGSVLDEGRERRIVDRLLARVAHDGRFPDEELRAIFQRIFEGSRRMQHEIHGQGRAGD